MLYRVGFRSANLLKMSFVTAAAMLLAVCLLTLSWDKPAEATLPGENGRIAFQSNRVTQDNPQGDYEIYKMNPDGSNPTRLTHNLGVDGESDWQPLTPKSRSLTVHPPDTGGPSLLLVAGALVFSGGIMFYAGVKRRM